MNITPEQIRALNAGTEADRLAAEYVMGWKWYWWLAADGIHVWRMLVSPDRAPHPSYKLWTPADGNIPISTVNLDLPAFSSEWDAMEQVVIQMRQRGWEWGMYFTKVGFMAGFDKTVKSGGSARWFVKERAEASGAPLAVVKAALLALVAEQEANNG